MSSPGRTLSTGEMVRATGLSMKALRLYDARGLLVPAHVDPSSGYRGYAPEQVERGRRIALLRRLEMPLDDVAAVLDADPARSRELLLDWWSVRRARLDQQRTVVRAVAGDLAPDPRPGGGPAVAQLAGRVGRRQAPARTLATITRTVRHGDLVPTFTTDVLTIRDHIAAVGATATAGHWVIYHEPPVAALPGRIETCVPYTGTAAPAGEVVLRADGGHVEAYLEVPLRDCGFPRIVAYHETLRALGCPVTRELYRGHWSDDPDEVVADVAAPLPEA